MLPISRIRRTVRDICVKNNADLALLFGSYARGNASERSDIDLIFVEETKQPFLQRLDRYFDILIDELGLPVDVFIYNSKEFDSMKKGFFIKKALNEGIILYESGKKRTGRQAVA